MRWGWLSTLPVPLPEAGRKLGILTKDDYLPTPYVAAFIGALRTVGNQMQQDVIADTRLTHHGANLGGARASSV